MPNIIVAGTNHHNTLSMVRCFGEAGYSILLIVYGDSESYVAKSVFVKKSFIVPTAEDTLDTLRQICETENETPVVITCSDEISSMMDLKYNDFEKLCYFFNAGEIGRITHYMDKQVQLELARACGYNVPNSQECYPGSIVYSSISYPCFIKPKESIHGGKNLAKCNNEIELRDASLKYDPSHKILIQDYIEKEYEIVILGLSVNGETYVPGFVKKHREFRGGTTYSTVYPISEISSELVNQCKSMLSTINYEGLWGVELIKNCKGYWFVELNLRNDATTYALSVSGVNLPVAYYQAKNGMDNSKILTVPVHKIDSMVEFEDFNYVIKCKVLIWKWYKQLQKCECRYFYSEKDNKPFELKKREYLKFLRKRILHI